MADFAGNTANDARRISIAATPRVFRDGLNRGDRDDFYRFSLGKRSSFQLNLNGIAEGADVDVELRNGRNQVLFRSAKLGRLGESINQILDKGTYFIRAFRKSGSTNYKLKVAAAPPPDLAGNTPSTARQIALSSTPGVYSDFVSTETDTSDYYRFTLANKTTRLSSSISGVTSDVQVNLFDSANRLIASNTSNAAPDFELILGTGTYYAQVKPTQGTTSYKLSLAGTPIADTAGETIATARPISLGANPIQLSDFVGAGDRDDYYKFTVRRNVTLNGSILTSPGSPLDSQTLRISLRNANDGILASYQSSLDPTFSYSLTPGTYYVRVSPILEAQATYDLNLSIA